MALEKQGRDYSTVDPNTGVWPVVVNKAARISDLIAALQRIQEEEGDIEIVKRVRNTYDGESDVDPLWSDEVSEVLDVMVNPSVTSPRGVYQDGEPVKGQYSATLKGKFLWMESQ